MFFHLIRAFASSELVSYQFRNDATQVHDDCKLLPLRRKTGSLFSALHWLSPAVLTLELEPKQHLAQESWAGWYTGWKYFEGHGQCLCWTICPKQCRRDVSISRMSDENMISKFKRKAQTQIGSQLCMPFFVARALSEDSPIEKVELCLDILQTWKTPNNKQSHITADQVCVIFMYVFGWFNFSDKGLVLRATWCATCHVQRGILDFIHQARSSEQHHILVNCVQGISRSAAVVSQRQTSQQKQAIRNSCFKAGSIANPKIWNLEI